MMGCGDENMPPNMDLLKQAGQGQNVGTGMSQEMMMMGCGDENMPPNMDLLKQAGQGQNFISGDRMEALLSGFNENSNGPGGFGTSSFKPGYGAEPYETSMDGVS